MIQAKAGQPATESPKTQSINAKFKTVKEILAEHSTKSVSWLIEDLIRSDDQVLLAGAPKTGKSFLAMQLCLALAEGANHQGRGYFLDPAFKLPKGPKDVLFFSFEMGQSVIAHRLRPHVDQSDQSRKGRLEELENLVFAFSLNQSSYLRITDVDSEEYQAAHDLIQDQKPDLIVFDTFVQIHQEEENDNVAMVSVLNRLRDLCKIREGDDERGIAHVIIHHLRKQSRFSSGGVESVRGAGAILGAPDTVLVLSRASSNGISQLSFTTRHIQAPDDLLIRNINDGEAARGKPVIFEKAQITKAALEQATKPSIPDNKLKTISAAVEHFLKLRPASVKTVDDEEILSGLKRKRVIPGKKKPGITPYYLSRVAEEKIVGWRFDQRQSVWVRNGKNKKKLPNWNIFSVSLAGPLCGPRPVNDTKA